MSPRNGNLNNKVLLGGGIIDLVVLGLEDMDDSTCVGLTPNCLRYCRPLARGPYIEKSSV